MSVLNIGDLRALSAVKQATKDVVVTQLEGSPTVRLRRLSAVGLCDVIDLWVGLPKDENGLALATAASLVEFYERLLADTVVDESNMPIFANLDDRKLLQQHPAALMFLGQQAQEFNSDLLMVQKEKKSEDRLENSLLNSAENSKSPTPTT